MTFSRKIVGFMLTAAVVGIVSVAHAADVKLIVSIGTGANQITSANVGPDVYVKTFYQWSIGLAALLAMAQLVLGGVQYVLSAGSIGSKEAANERIRGSLTGLLILIAIVTVLTTINPNLATLSPATTKPPVAGSIDFSALDSASFNTLDSLSSATSTTGAVAAQGRVQASSNPAFQEAVDAMKEEIDEFVSRDDDDLQEVVGSAGLFTDVDDTDMPLSKLRDLVSQRKISVTRDTNGAADFYEYAKKAFDEYAVAAAPNRDLNKTLADGYSDAVRVAVNYAMKTMSRDDQMRMVLLISVVEPKEIKNIILGKYAP